MDKKFLVKLIIFGVLAVFFLMLMFPYLFVSTPLHALVKIQNRLAEKYSVVNPKVSAHWDERDRLDAVEISYETAPAVFADSGRLEREMNRVVYGMWKELQEYNREVEAANEVEKRKFRERREQGNLKAQPKRKMIFRPRKYLVTARAGGGSGCAKGKAEKKELEYGELVFARIRQFNRRAEKIPVQVKNRSGLSVTVTTSIVFPAGPFGVTLRTAGVQGENSSELLQEAADFVLAGWKLSTAKLTWVEVVDAGTGESHVAGEKPGAKKTLVPEPEPRPGDSAPKE